MGLTLLWEEYWAWGSTVRRNSVAELHAVSRGIHHWRGKRLDIRNGTLYSQIYRLEGDCMDQIRIAVVGLGSRNQALLRAVLAAEEFAVVGASDHDTQQVDSLAGAFGDV